MRLYGIQEVLGLLGAITPDGISYTPYNGDNRAGWYIPYPSPFDYSKAREFLAKGSNLSDAYTWLGVFPKAEVLWPDVEPWNQYSKNERGHGFQYMGRQCENAWTCKKGAKAITLSNSD